MSRGEKFIQVHSPSSVWVQSINTSGFEICAREAGINKNESGIVNWLAFQDQLQLSPGSVVLSGIWTTETKCNKVTFTQVKPIKVVCIIFCQFNFLYSLSFLFIILTQLT